MVSRSRILILGVGSVGAAFAAALAKGAFKEFEVIGQDDYYDKFVRHQTKQTRRKLDRLDDVCIAPIRWSVAEARPEIWAHPREIMKPVHQSWRANDSAFLPRVRRPQASLRAHTADRLRRGSFSVT
jgi:hypothetical protein